MSDRHFLGSAERLCRGSRPTRRPPSTAPGRARARELALGARELRAAAGHLRAQLAPSCARARRPGSSRRRARRSRRHHHDDAIATGHRLSPPCSRPASSDGDGRGARDRRRGAGSGVEGDRHGEDGVVSAGTAAAAAAAGGASAGGLVELCSVTFADAVDQAQALERLRDGGLAGRAAAEGEGRDAARRGGGGRRRWPRAVEPDAGGGGGARRSPDPVRSCPSARRSRHRSGSTRPNSWKAWAQSKRVSTSWATAFARCSRSATKLV